MLYYCTANEWKDGVVVAAGWLRREEGSKAVSLHLTYTINMTTTGDGVGCRWVGGSDRVGVAGPKQEQAGRTTTGVGK